MQVEMIACTKDPELLIERAGRECYDSFDKLNPPESTKRIIEHLLKSGHTSVLEHASATFRVTEISRALSHQLVRHRIASYSQRSQRYVRETKPEFVKPSSINTAEREEAFGDAMRDAWHHYHTLLMLGVPAEDARFVLPNACHTSIVVTMNFRALRNFFSLRCSPHAQWEIRGMAFRMLALVKLEAPNVFIDFNEGLQGGLK